MHRLAAVASVLGIGGIFLVRWFTDPRHNLPPFAVGHLPHAAATIAAAVILVVGTVLLARAGEALRQAGIVPEGADEDAIRARRGAAIAAWQLLATAALGVCLVALFGFADPVPGWKLPDETIVWPALAALALSEAMCVAWAWEGVAIAEDAAAADDLPATPPPPPVSSPYPQVPPPPARLWELLAAQAQPPPASAASPAAPPGQP